MENTLGEDKCFNKIKSPSINHCTISPLFYSLKKFFFNFLALKNSLKSLY